AGCRYSLLNHGRYFVTLTVPGVLAIEAAARHFFGRHAGRFLAASVALFGVMGMVLLHGQVIPRYHPPHDRFASPDYVAYVDAGTEWAKPFTEAGTAVWEPAWSPRPEGSVIVDPVEVRI